MSNLNECKPVRHTDPAQPQMIQHGTTVRQQPWAVGDRVQVPLSVDDWPEGEIADFTSFGGYDRAVVKFENGSVTVPLHRLRRQPKLEGAQ